MKSYVKIIFVCLSIFISFSANYANANNFSGLMHITGGGEGEGIINRGDSTANKICLIRQLFCGRAAMVTVTMAVLFLGFLVLTNKAHWSLVLIVGTGVIVFMNADEIARMIASPSFAIAANCSCGG